MTNAVIRAECPQYIAEQLAANGTVRAIVNERWAVVSALVWEPITLTERNPRIVQARLIPPTLGINYEVSGTPVASSGIQEIIAAARHQ